MKNKNNLHILLCLLATAVFCLLTGCGSSKADPFSYVSVSYSGYDSNGTAHVNFDEDSLIETIIGKEPDDFSKWGDWFNAYEELSANIDVSCVPSQNLSNGDTVTVLVTVSDDAAKKISGGETKFQVSGLPEIQTIDFFKDIEITYEGIAGGLTSVQLTRLSDDEALQACSFHIEPQSSIKNGDTITVTITNSENLAKQYLCIPEETTKTFTVSGLNEYLSDPDLLPEDLLREIIAQYVPASAEEDDFIFSYSEPEYYKAYLCIGNKGRIGADYNRLEIFVRYDEFMDGELRNTIYKPLTFRNVIIYADGTIELKYEDGETIVFYTDPDGMVEKMEEDYTVEEVYVEYEK